MFCGSPLDVEGTDLRGIFCLGILLVFLIRLSVVRSDCDDAYFISFCPLFSEFTFEGLSLLKRSCLCL